MVVHRAWRYWNFDDHIVESRQRARAGHAVELLRQYAGESSIFFKNAQQRISSNERSPASGVYELSDLLEEWAAALEDGLLDMPAHLRGARALAANDLMEQVGLLLADKHVHVAAPMVLAGAALEELLRAMVEFHDLSPSGQPGLQSYAQALRAQGVLSVQQVKDVTQVAGLRNLASHGVFDDLSRSNAQLMAQQVNLLLSNLGQVTAR